jgi:type I restriction enzyme S subunit
MLVKLTSSIDEQKAIAKILSDIDEELLKLEERHNKTKQLKQAMMQELLTGKTRLVKPEATHA